MRHDCLVVGGGIVGLALSHALLLRRPGLRLLLLDKEGQVGRHQTGHNSGVIHSGIYYRPGSHKARTCRRGYNLLLAFCREQQVAHEICGKLVVAVEEREKPWLAELHCRGEANGLTGLRCMPLEAMREIEPHVAGVEGLWVPQTGIVDFAAVANRLAELVRGMGGEIVLGEEVVAMRTRADCVEVETANGCRQARHAVNCAGLQSDRLARFTRPDLPVRIIPFRGEYYILRPERRELVRNLIYPVPDPSFPFLGVHFTRMVGGEVEAGPNAVLAFKREGYEKTDFSWRDVRESLAWPGLRILARRHWRAGLGEIHRSYSKAAFVAALQRLIPEVVDADFLPGNTGVRAQACDREGRLLDDFYFVEGERVLHVLNAPSPAATAALAIGEYLCEIFLSRL